jgi:hypothetical protein
MTVCYFFILHILHVFWTESLIIVHIFRLQLFPLNYTNYMACLSRTKDKYSENINYMEKCLKIIFEYFLLNALCPSNILPKQQN